MFIYFLTFNDILVECNNEIRVTKTMTDMPLLLSLKFQIAQPEVNDELENIDQQNLNCNEYKLCKLDNDRWGYNFVQIRDIIYILRAKKRIKLFTIIYRKLLINVVTATYIDLIETKTFNVLKFNVDAIVNLDNYRLQLSDEETKNKM